VPPAEGVAIPPVEDDLVAVPLHTVVEIPPVGVYGLAVGRVEHFLTPYCLGYSLAVGRVEHFLTPGRLGYGLAVGRLSQHLLRPGDSDFAAELP
jgi:hypothetical protein